ncbi:putative ABC transport system permease protein [Catalinimonas alkaloidigena]|uniref:ABC transporter permease n=1 Tax=Catalinimonas alkaloidigena TaxID=1075417 RepID=UPI002404CBE1|nr:ABC transporter permease [Catalinimonas alkaloidigena]MDF9798475.1 putative ABC transport system permease protein [Catalinimonas alkaloidigena]
MNLLLLSWSYIKTKPLNTTLNILLLSLGIAIITVLLLLSRQMEESLTQNSKGIDLVVGAKGSPLQIILSSVFHIDYPTGNISLQEAKNLSRNRLIRNTIPMALGDSYQGSRIVGTTYEYLKLYNAEITKGRLWTEVMEVAVGAQAAQDLGLQAGDTFSSSHGLADDNINVHDEKPYRVVGILAPTRTVVDNLILTAVESVWETHASHEPAASDSSTHEEEEHDHPDADSAHTHAYDSIATQGLPLGDSDDQITSLLVQYRSPMAAVQLPRYINERSNMQAASPPFETARLFSLVGIGVDLLQAFAYVIIIIAGLSIFIALYNALKERKYDLAIMRSLGASKTKLFVHVILEGLIITLLGSILGLLLGHITIAVLGKLFTQSSQIGLSAFRPISEEYLVLIGSLLIGIVASVIPAINAYRTNISSILSQG